ncbi:MAG: MoaF N-terminal domain-containing protein, partial [Aquiluna sp.]
MIELNKGVWMTVDVAPISGAAVADEWRTYDDFAAGIDTYRLPDADLSATSYSIQLKDGPQLDLTFTSNTHVRWSGNGILASSDSSDPYEAVQVRPDVLFVNLPLASREREQLTLVISTKTARVAAVHSVIQPESQEGTPQVSQSFWSGTVSG